MEIYKYVVCSRLLKLYFFSPFNQVIYYSIMQIFVTTNFYLFLYSN